MDFRRGRGRVFFLSDRNGRSPLPSSLFSPPSPRHSFDLDSRERRDGGVVAQGQGRSEVLHKLGLPLRGRRGRGSRRRRRWRSHWNSRPSSFSSIAPLLASVAFSIRAACRRRHSLGLCEAGRERKGLETLRRRSFSRFCDLKYFSLEEHKKKEKKINSPPVLPLVAEAKENSKKKRQSGVNFSRVKNGEDRAALLRKRIGSFFDERGVEGDRACVLKKFEFRF